jgi:hypothetical protein
MSFVLKPNANDVADDYRVLPGELEVGQPLSS